MPPRFIGIRGESNSLLPDRLLPRFSSLQLDTCQAAVTWQPRYEKPSSWAAIFILSSFLQSGKADVGHGELWKKHVWPEQVRRVNQKRPGFILKYLKRALGLVWFCLALFV